MYSDDYGGDEKAFPFDKAVQLINEANTSRDKALFALLAAGGPRISEALMILIDDIDFKNKKIYIIPPDTRKDILKDFISENELDCLSTKGRESIETYLIRPFDLLFWKYLDEYLNSEYQRHVKHRFLFQKQDGMPLINSYRYILETFQKLSVKITNFKYGLHSMRHMYGYYLKNWCPTVNGFGFSLSEVQLFMGHKEIKSTKRYARDDSFKLTAAISYANTLADQGNKLNIIDSKIEMLQKEINRLKKIQNYD